MTTNPVLSGFSPDPSVLATEQGYFIATSTFEWFPGVRLYHSTNLSTWKELPSPLDRQSILDMRGDANSSGVWAPDISFKDGVYYLVYTDVKTQTMGYYNTPNYLVTARDPAGPWSEAVYLNSSGFDPSLFHDEDGKTYLVNMRNGFKGVLVQEFDTTTMTLMGDVRNIYAGTHLGFTEGPHLYRMNGWYYLITAEGGTGYGHCVTQARSKSLFGPYETAPAGPLITSRDDAALALQKAGHGDILKTAEGKLLLFFLCARPHPAHHRCVLGRETAVMPLRLTDEGWLELECGGHHPKITVDLGVNPAVDIETPTGKDYTDHFDGDALDRDTLDGGWKRLRVPFGNDITLKAKSGCLSLYGRESINSLHRVSLVARKQEFFKLSTETLMEAPVSCEEEQAGLVYLYNNAHFHLLVKTVNALGNPCLVLFTCNAGTLVKKAEVLLSEDQADKALMLSLETDSETARFFWKTEEDESFTQIGGPCDASILSDEHARGFTGAHVGLYCHDMTGKGFRADFDYFTLRKLD